MKPERLLRAAMALIGLALLTAWPAHGQQRPNLTRIGFVTFQGPDLASHLNHLRLGLQEHGYSESVDYTIEALFADGDRQRAEEFVRALVSSGVNVIVAWTTPAGAAAKKATHGTGIPVVIVTSDPVAAGLVESLARPGGNLTGISMASPDLSGKRMEALREVMPAIRSIAFLGNARSANAELFLRNTRSAAERLGIGVVGRMVERPGEIDQDLLLSMKQEGAQALLVQPNLTGQARRIVDLADKVGLPVVSDHPPFAQAGALLTYGADETKHIRRAAYFVDRLLKGGRPAELPIEQPTSFSFVLNLKVARRLGLAISPATLARVDEVVD